MTVLRGDGLTVDLGGRRVLDRIDIALAGGEMVGVVGPNGAGKTTLIRALAGLQAPSRGAVALDGREMGRLPRRELAVQVGYLPQDAPCHWPLTVARLVALGRLPHLAPWARPAERDRRAVTAAMAAAEVTPLAARTVTGLSSGERARVLLARALASEPKVLLADEPVAALDPLHRLTVVDLLRRRARHGMAVLVALHDLALAVRFCDRLVLLAEGRVAAEGRPEDVLADDRLRSAFGISAVRGCHDGVPYLVPWQPTGHEPGAAEDRRHGS